MLKAKKTKKTAEAFYIEKGSDLDCPDLVWSIDAIYLDNTNKQYYRLTVSYKDNLLCDKIFDDLQKARGWLIMHTDDFDTIRREVYKEVSGYEASVVQKYRTYYERYWFDNTAD